MYIIVRGGTINQQVEMSVTVCEAKEGFLTSLSQSVGACGEGGVVLDFSLYTATLINNRITQKLSS
jgi:hypothetical protein